MQCWKWGFGQLLRSSLNLYDPFSMEESGHSYAPVPLIFSCQAKRPMGFVFVVLHLPGWGVQLPSSLAEICGSAPASNRWARDWREQIGKTVVSAHWSCLFTGVLVDILCWHNKTWVSHFKGGYRFVCLGKDRWIQCLYSPIFSACGCLYLFTWW